MKYLIEYNKFYKIGDIVFIEYFYNHMITKVKIIDIKGNKYTISHNIPESKIFNAPDEVIKSNQIISHI
jgi:hypothetical protein